MSKKKFLAVSKIVVGAGKMAGGGITAAGKGAVGGLCRQSGMISAARNLGRSSYAGGQKLIDEGVRQWRATDD